MRILVIPDIHLKPWIFDEAEKVSTLAYDAIACLGDDVEQPRDDKVEHICPDESGRALAAGYIAAKNPLADYLEKGLEKAGGHI